MRKNESNRRLFRVTLQKQFFIFHDQIISILIVLLALLGLTRCNLAETETVEHVPCPQVGIDTLIVPGWDEQPAQ